MVKSEKIKELSLSTPIDISKMKGHTTITLTNVKTGEVETHEDDNMMTNAIAEYFRNCGFVNIPNVNINNLVEELLGGVMGFDNTINENANIIHVPAGLKMTFNGSVGSINNSPPTELGSYSSSESGWQNDGSYVMTFDYSTSQANGTIACVCLTSKRWGYIGEGNATSEVRASSRADIRYIYGNINGYSLGYGINFNIDVSDSSFYNFNIEEFEEGGETVRKGIIRKCRIPTTKLNLKSTQTAPIILSESIISLNDDFLNATSLQYQMLGNNLMLWDCSNQEWGVDFTQHLWTLTPSGTITQTTITNTTGDTGLCGLGAAYFTGDYCFFPKNYIDGNNKKATTKTVYIWKRSTGVIHSVENPYGYNWTYNYSNPFSNVFYMGWDLYRACPDGRIITTGGNPYFGFVVDGVLEKTWVNNAMEAGFGVMNDVTGLLHVVKNSTGFLRDMSYIASINNLTNPIVKTSDKTMKVVYRITFDDLDNE